MTTKKLYTVIIFSENTVGLLNQITIIFTRRQLNIETLSVSPSAIQGIHKFTITTFADEDNDRQGCEADRQTGGYLEGLL